MALHLPAGTASLCLVCHAPVSSAGALHCGPLCRDVWSRLIRVRSAESCGPLPDEILVILDHLETGQPLPLREQHRLGSWLSE